MRRNVPTVTRGKPPCEENIGIRSYQNGKRFTVSQGVFRATFSSLHFDSSPAHVYDSGESMNLLYHHTYGILCAATTARYSPTEPLNQQYLRKVDDPPCMTAQFVVNGVMACTENGSLSAEDTCVTAIGKGWKAEYSFRDKTLEICLSYKKLPTATAVGKLFIK